LLAEGDYLAAREILLDRPADDAAALRALARTERGLAGWHAERGLESLRAGELGAAAESLDLALAIDPDHTGARRGRAALGAALVQRAAAAEALDQAIRERRWRLAFDVATLLPAEELVLRAPALGVELRGEAVLAELSERLFERLELEVRSAYESGRAERLDALVREAERALARRTGERAADGALADRVAEWRALHTARRAANDHRFEAGIAPDGTDDLHLWRLYRLARELCPGDPVLAAEEEGLRARVRERALAVLHEAERDCDSAAARAGLELVEELAEGWPEGAPRSRESLLEWLAEDLEHRARDAERRGATGAAILAWLSLVELSGDSEADHRAARLIERVRAAPLLHARSSWDAPEIAGPGELEVILLPPRVEEEVDRVLAVESVGCVRTGAEQRIDVWRANDARRWQESLTAVLLLGEEWLGARTSRSVLGERRLRFHLVELQRLSERLRRVAPTSERGVWRSQELEIVTERRRMRVVQPLILRRGGATVAEMSVVAEDVLSAWLPEGAPEGRIEHLPAGEAERERVRLRLEAECRRLTPQILSTLRRGEVARGVARAQELWSDGDAEGAVEAMVEAWSIAGREDGALRERAASSICDWTGIAPETLARASFP